MKIVTVAVVSALNEKEDGSFWCDPFHAPIWTDGKSDYLVASGPSDDDMVTSSPVKAQVSRVNIVVGKRGLEALSEMGLSAKQEEADG